MKIRLPPLYSSQLEIAQHEARFKVISNGRRWGKTYLASEIAIATALKGGRVYWVAPTFDLGKLGWREMTGIAQQIPGHNIGKAARSIHIMKGEIWVKSADNPLRLKGDKLDLVIFDEAAQCKQEAWTESLRPALADKLGKAIFISTPRGKNWFYHLWLRGIEGEDPEYKSWQRPTSDNPFILASEIESARGDIPEALFEQEYLAVFLENKGAVFRRISEALNAPLDASPEDHKDHELLAGIDWGRYEDFTAISVGCLDCRMEVFKDRFNQIDYNFQSERVKNIHRAWGVKLFLAEKNAMGDPIISRLQDEGLPVVGFQTTQQSKNQLIRGFSLLIENQTWQFQADPVWDAELEAYEQKVSPNTGLSFFSAPEGFHDDTIIGRALMTKAEDYIMTGSLFL